MPLNLRKGWYEATNGYIYVWEPEHPNADIIAYLAMSQAMPPLAREITRRWISDVPSNKE